jgi:hypothetical protein
MPRYYKHVNVANGDEPFRRISKAEVAENRVQSFDVANVKTPMLGPLRIVVF